MVAATMKDIAAALARLDHESRAVLDLTFRKGEDAEVGHRRADALDKLASELGLSEREELEELTATLPDLPAEMWSS